MGTSKFRSDHKKNDDRDQDETKKMRNEQPDFSLLQPVLDVDFQCPEIKGGFF
jgi:hypothetical protein